MKISVIFPVKNQSEKLIKHLKETGIPFYDSLGVTYDFLIVSDGSNEKNQALLEKAMEEMPLQVKLLPYEAKKGKGHNVNKGILAADGDYVMFMDADFATDLNAIKPILKTLPKYDCYVASRYAKESQMPIKAPFFRRLMSKVSRTLIKMKFHFSGLTDTQCGYKIFKTSIAKEMAKRQIIDRFAFDVEYLYFFSLNGYSIKEIPVIWTDDPQSTVGKPIQSSLEFMKDLRKIKANKKNYILSEAEKEGLKKC